MKHIRIISPSGHLDPSYIDGAITRLRAWGYKVSEGAHTRDAWGRFAGTDNDRIADLVDALNNPSVDMILCARGGYGLQRIIDRVPAIHKPIIGFSDITELHQACGLSGQSSLHGIMCKHIATLPEDSEPILALRKALAGDPLTYHWEHHPLNQFGDACAPIVGGNLSVLYGLQGTSWGLQSPAFRLQFPILLIEDIAERHYHIDRMMRNLRMSGVLAHLSGLIVGQFSDCEDDPSMHGTVYQTIKEVVADYNYPVIFNAPVGHVERNLPLWVHGHTTVHCGADGVLITNSL
ncbi:MAG: LD-carboxypeptidase [Paludibacteraceae bacterium]|nr:LD-carboxypeptidase [Paludibacteraceae bacterium]MBQ4017665.1 LD-carboxypeptidase [Paludibacteraceae bacterium]